MGNGWGELLADSGGVLFCGSDWNDASVSAQFQHVKFSITLL